MAVERIFLSVVLGILLLAAAPTPNENDPPHMPSGQFCTDDMEIMPDAADPDAVPVAQTTDQGCELAQPVAA